MKFKPIPTTYRGVKFASALEADWAATFDWFGWQWEYEPLGVQLDDGQWYRPDFYLPTQRVWAEAKGPHNERLDKPAGLQTTLPGDAFEWDADLVVILRPSQAGDYGEAAHWENAIDGQDIVMILCPECKYHGFMDLEGIWSCRRHMRKHPEPNKFWTHKDGGLWRSGELPFIRAPRDRPGPTRLDGTDWNKRRK